MRAPLSREAKASWFVGVTALVVGTWGVWSPGLWYDEVVTLTMADRDWQSMFSVLTRIDAVHGVYYALMHLWIDAFAYTPLTLRLPSAILMAATAVVLVRIGSLQWSLTAGVVAGLSFMAIPRTLWVATQGRSYALAVFTISLATLLFILAIKRERAQFWFVYGASMALAICAFIHNALLLLVFLIVVFAQDMPREQVRKFVIASGLALAVSFPLILTAVSQRGQISWIKETSLKRALTAPYYAFLDGTSSLLAAVTYAGFFAGCWFVLTWVTLRRRTVGTGPLNSRAFLMLISFWLLIPGGVLLTVGAFIPVYYDTYLAISVPALALIAGGGVAAMSGARWWISAIVILALGIIAYQPWAFFRSPNSKSDILDAVALIETYSRPGDSVLFVEGPGWNTRQLSYAYPDSFSGLEDLTLGKPYYESDTFFGTSQPLGDVTWKLNGADRIVAIANKPDSSGSRLSSDMAILRGLGYVQVSANSTGDWRVLVFTR